VPVMGRKCIVAVAFTATNGQLQHGGVGSIVFEMGMKCERCQSCVHRGGGVVSEHEAH
jgi:hypothetical protein